MLPSELASAGQQLTATFADGPLRFSSAAPFRSPKASEMGQRMKMLLAAEWW